jgi:hypothetical protein
MFIVDVILILPEFYGMKPCDLQQPIQDINAREKELMINPVVAMPQFLCPN